MSNFNFITMGIVKGIFGTKISGKVGSVVFRNNGEVNTISEKPANVKNPRTDAQQGQRMCMVTVNAAYKAMKTICDHSFEGIAYGGASMNYFMRENSKRIQIGKYATTGFMFNAKGNAFAVTNSYLMSKGSLPTIDVITDVSKDEGIKINTSLTTTAETTVQQFHDQLGCDLGDQITICVLAPVQTIAYNQYGVTQNETVFKYARLIFDTSAGAEKLLTGSSINSAALDTEKSENVSILSIANNIITVAGNYSTNSEMLPGAVIIRSKKVGNTWQRSSQNMVFAEAGAGGTNYGYSSVLRTYEPTGEKYLNNAEQ